MPGPPREDHQPSPDEIEETIDGGDEVDEAGYESFPASDPPAWATDRAGPRRDDDEAEAGRSGSSGAG